jgi:UDP-GlcNAc:undecaprenyl-phosphate GlcNAc-1-phosphate transferase
LSSARRREVKLTPALVRPFSITLQAVTSSALAATFALAGLLSLGTTLLCERLARRVGLLAHPREDRWHRGSVPMLGGPAIVLSVVGIGAATGAFSRFGPLVGLAVGMAGVGLVDDCRPLHPRTKLAAQLVAAAALVGAGTVWPVTAVWLVDAGLTVLWVTGVTNAFNFLDNMDGLAGAVAVLTACVRAALYLLDGDGPGAMMMLTVAGAVGGFLVRNAPPARIFMGDAGSLFLGFLLGGASLVTGAAEGRGRWTLLVVPVLLVLVPLVDATFVTLTRVRDGRSVLRGGRDHLSHRLVALGLSERQAVAVLLGIATVSGCLAVLSSRVAAR